MKPLIVALDVDTKKEVSALIRATQEYVDIFKVGPTLILKYGPQIINEINKFGKKVFLDLKFHDIPNTMLRSIREASAAGVYSATVHTSAGLAAMATLAKEKKRPLLWGVTVLTSMSQEDLIHLGISKKPFDQVLSLANLAKEALIDGVVASVEETAALRKILKGKVEIITPGIRLPENERGDQKRVATPFEAKKAGSTFIVVGRPILESKTPDLIAKKIMADWLRIR
ncbi:MAG: orotidine-5'-phosphate decarboxylase [Elusimicrobiota bacterium]